MLGRRTRRRDQAETDRLAGQFLAGREPLFATRISGGHIVDGHGDLLADDIYCLTDGPRILDCLDFDDRLRWLDGLDDVAFLAMDLERLGAAGPGPASSSTGTPSSPNDQAPTSLRHHYVAYRAFVRAKVACIQAGQRRLCSGRRGTPAGRYRCSATCVRARSRWC